MRFKIAHIAFLLAAACAPAAAFAADQVATDAVRIIKSDVARTDDNMFVKMDLDLSDYKGMKSNREVTITPMLVSGTDTLALDPIMVAGRNRYYLHLRQDENKRQVRTLYRAGVAKTVEYSTDFKAQPWMDVSELILSAKSCGCCGEPIAAVDIPVIPVDFSPKEAPKFEPVFAFIQPTAEIVKNRELRGQAYIDFPVNRTELYPDYRRNPQELAKIRATIDSVRYDKDVTLQAMTIKGYASPEGPYNNNVRLAKGRTETLKKYVMNLYSFPAEIISTSYDPEDWGGLRRYVENSNLDNRQAILDIIDSDLAPDPKNEAIKRRFPQQYAFLLKEVYPGLRHSDYTVEYTVRNYTDINEIKEILRTKPANLSLNEMYLAANTMEVGSPEYNHAFEVAVLLYPENEEANLNAANIAMQEGNLEKAERYLAKAGDGAEAIYARGILKALQADYPAALDLFRQAARLNVADAPAAISQIEKLMSTNSEK